jgi:hypothetical protein
MLNWVRTDSFMQSLSTADQGHGLWFLSLFAKAGLNLPPFEISCSLPPSRLSGYFKKYNSTQNDLFLDGQNQFLKKEI